MKSTRVPVIIFLILLVAGCHTSSRPPMQNIFSLNFQENQTYEYHMDWDFEQSLMGQTTKISFNSLYSLNVEDNNAFEKTLTGVYRNFKMNVKGMGIEMDIDTEKPLPPAPDSVDAMGFVKQVFHAIIGKPFKMIVNAKGELQEVKGFNEILESIADSVKITGEAKAFAVASLKEQFNNEAIKDQFVQLFAIFPNKTVKEGDSWVKSYAFGGKIPAKFVTTYTVKKIEGDFVTLDLTSRIDSDLDVGIVGDQTGTMVADSRWGLVVSADFKQNMGIKNEEFVMMFTGTGKIRGKAVETK